MSIVKKAVQKKEVRSFGMVLAGILVVVFGISVPLIQVTEIPIWPYFVALILVMLCWLHYPLVIPLYRFWMKVGAVLGWINVRIILGIAFVFLIIPTALVVFLNGSDLLSRKLDRKKPTYRTISTIRAAKDMEKPY